MLLAAWAHHPSVCSLRGYAHISRLRDNNGLTGVKRVGLTHSVPLIVYKRVRSAVEETHLRVKTKACMPNMQQWKLQTSTHHGYIYHVFSLRTRALRWRRWATTILFFWHFWRLAKPETETVVVVRWRPSSNVRALVNTGSRLLRGAYREKWRRQNGVASAPDRSANYRKICS